MEERICDTCQSRNDDTADFCWQCYDKLAPVFRMEPVGAMAAPMGSVPAPAYSALAAAMAPPAPHLAGSTGAIVIGAVTEPPKRSISVAAIVYSLLGLALGYLLISYVTRSSFELPGSVHGLPSVENAQSAMFEGMLGNVAGQQGVEMDSAVYGAAGTTEYFALAMEKPETGASPSIQSLLELSGSPEGTVPGSELEETRDGAELWCATFKRGITASMCVWQGPSTIGVVVSETHDPAESLEFAAAVHRGMEI